MLKNKKIKAIDALNWFFRNICSLKCQQHGLKKLDCYEKMLQIISGFENYPVTIGQFIFSMRIKNKVCELNIKQFKEKKLCRCKICGNEFIPRKPNHRLCNKCFLKNKLRNKRQFKYEETEEIEEEYRHICIECFKYSKRELPLIQLPSGGWGRVCEECLKEIFSSEVDDYDQDGVLLGEEWNFQYYDYGDDPGPGMI